MVQLKFCHLDIYKIPKIKNFFHMLKKFVQNQKRIELNIRTVKFFFKFHVPDLKKNQNSIYLCTWI